jgi:hypothetical protein
MVKKTLLLDALANILTGKKKEGISLPFLIMSGAIMLRL